MAKMYKLEGKVELNCEAKKLFEMLSAKQTHIPSLCSDKVPGVEAHQGDLLSPGSIRKWDFVIGDKSIKVIEKIEAIDEAKMIITRNVIDGDLMKNYKTLIVHTQQISNGKNSSILICKCEYEKIDEDAPEPKEFLDFSLGVLKDLGDHLSSPN